MSFIYLLCLFLLKGYNCLELVKGWEYLNLKCRDQHNEPVDWWYIYKPPSNSGPDMTTGTNFSYITPNTIGRWTPSGGHIFADSMLMYTMAPMFQEEYAEYMGIVEYEGKEPNVNFKGSASLGLMMANSMGGLWIGHTVPGFPDLIMETPMFPLEELKNGHIIMCLTLDLPTLNTLAAAIKQTEPHFRRISIPSKMERYLPEWKIFLFPLPKTSRTSIRKTKILHFVTMDKSLYGIIFARSPGDSRCLYKSFAKIKQIVMDVYGHKEHRSVFCSNEFSVRNINSISLNSPTNVYYIKNSSDSMGFAVSTGGAWQRQGISKNQYWTCTGNIENQPLYSSLGGMIICVTNFRVWVAFDNLKVTEPVCT